jgi:hypothetical protein
MSWDGRGHRWCVLVVSHCPAECRSVGVAVSFFGELSFLYDGVLPGGLHGVVPVVVSTTSFGREELSIDIYSRTYIAATNRTALIPRCFRSGLAHSQ